jgi:hypothetical protein
MSHQVRLSTQGTTRVAQEPNDLIRAAFYGLVLRAEGYAPDEAAALVVERYPGARERLQSLLVREPETKARAATP